MDGNRYNFKDTIFVIARDSVDEFYANGTKHHTCKFVVNFVLARAKEHFHIVHKVYGDIMETFGNNELAKLSIDSMLKDGAITVGKGTFNDEDKDLIFLAGGLSYLNKNKHIIIVTEHDYALKKEINTKHADVLQRLALIGFTDLTKRSIFSLESLVGIIAINDKPFYDKFYTK